MTVETHTQLANFIWGICNLLRGPYKRNEYRKVILPLTVLRRFDCLLAPTKAQVLAEHPRIKGKPDTVVRSLLENITKRSFYNLSKLDLPKLLDDPNEEVPAPLVVQVKQVEAVLVRPPTLDRETARRLLVDGSTLEAFGALLFFNPILRDILLNRRGT